MKKIWILLGVGIFTLSNATFAAVNHSQIKDFSSKLETNKTKLIKNIDESKVKLKNVAKEASKFSDTSLFKAASCLGAIPAEDQNLNFDKITTTLKEEILNEYIKLDGEIKRLSFGMKESDPLIFGNSLDTFYNQNALKISKIENDYYLKTEKVKKTFLEYVENNKTLLTKLAQDLDSIETFQKAASGATSSLETFKKEVNTRSEFLKTLEKAKTDSEASFAAELERVFNQAMLDYHPDDATQAKYLIHKDNFLKKFKSEIGQAQYYLFSAIFSYADYMDLLAKKADLEKQFYTASGTIDCNLLLTTSMNLGKYTQGADVKSEKIQKGLQLLIDATKNGKLNMKVLEEPTISYFKTTNEKLTRKLIANFKAMLDAEKPQTSTLTTGEVANEPQSQTEQIPFPPEKVVFTQAFKKGQYHEQIKTLQTLLKNWGYYQGEINGVYSPATIEAVYKFQLKEGIITGKEKNKAGYGRFWVKTREKLNSSM